LDQATVAAAYQRAVMGTLVKRVEQALNAFPDWSCVACVGGVAKNAYLREKLLGVTHAKEVPLVTVPIAAVPLLRTIEPLRAPPSADPNLQLSGMRLRG
jgi:tRNA A37 threonylcarbamoyltransferase TsaD